MIKKGKKQVKLKFGKGDICITSGHINNKNKKNGIVTFSNQKPRKIGEQGEIKAEQNYNLDNFPVIMVFSEKESIDVVIKELLEAKANMN